MPSTANTIKLYSIRWKNGRMVTMLKFDNGGGKIPEQKQITQTTTPTKKEQPKPVPPTPQAPPPHKPEFLEMPKEIKIIVDTFHAQEEILYAAINQLMQLYGPVDYSEERQVYTDMNIAALRAKFPQDLVNMLSFEDKGDYWRIQPKQFLGSQNFADIAALVRNIGGEYISAGRDSHFRVYKNKA